MYKLKKIVSSNNFSAQFIEIMPHYKKRLAITLMYCNRLHNWWSTQSRLATLLSSLIARQWDQTRLYDGSHKDLSIDEMVGAWYFGCLSGPHRFTCWISFAPLFSFIYCWVLIFASSPCDTLIYMFWRWCIDKLGVFHANQISICLDPHLNLGWGWRH